MEDIMDSPIVWEEKAIGDRGDNFGDREGSIALRIQLADLVGEFQVGRF